MKNFIKILMFVAIISISNATNANETLGATEAKLKIVSVYPNPASSQINFDVKFLDKGYTITIFNFIGKKVEEIKVTNTTSNLSLENYFRGVYIYQLRDKKGNIIESGKFQVVK